MRHIWIAPVLLTVVACGPRDRCAVPPPPHLIAVKDLTLVQKADILGVPPSRVPEGAGHRVEKRGQVGPQLRQLPCVHELILPQNDGTARSRNGVILRLESRLQPVPEVRV